MATGFPCPGWLELVHLYETAAAWVAPAPVVGLALNGVGAPPGALSALAAAFEAETGRPAVDPMVGADRLVEALRAEAQRLGRPVRHPSPVQGD